MASDTTHSSLRTTSGKEWNNTFDLIRLIAIFFVLVHHYQYDYFPAWLTEFSDATWVVIDAFFVQSGYLISRQLITQFGRRPNAEVLQSFYIRRGSRILPTYFVCFLIAYLLDRLVLQRSYFPDIWNYLLLAQNLRWDSSTTPFTPFVPSWSVCIEAHFYLLFPLVACWLFTKPRISQHGVYLLVAAIVLISPLARWWTWEQHLGGYAAGSETLLIEFHRYLYFPTHLRLEGLALGVVVGTLEQFNPQLLSRAVTKWKLLLALSAGIYIVGYELFAQRVSLSSATIGMSLSALIATFVTLAAMSPSLQLRGSLTNVTKFGANLIYPLYLIHTPISYSIRHLSEVYAFTYSTPILFCSYFLLSIAAAWLIHRFVDVPFMALRARLLKRR